MSTNETTQSYRKVTIGSERNFGIVFAAFFALVGLAPLYRSGHVRWWGIVISAALLVCAFTAPRLLRPLNRIWFKVGLLLHHVINPIVMGVMYFGAFVPTGLFLRLLGKDILCLKFNKSAVTYWIPRDPPGPASGSMTKQF